MSNVKKYAGWLLLFVLLLQTPSVLALDYGGIGVQPANPDPNNPRTQSIFVYQLEAGKDKEDGVKVVNSTDKKASIDLYAVDSQVSSDGGLGCAQKVDPKKEVGSWVKLEKTSVTLEARQSEIVPFKVSVPKNASVGEHDGCIVVQSADSKLSGEGGVALSFRSALRMVITVPGQITKKLSFDSIDYFTDKSGKHIIKPSIKNEGNVSVDTDVNAKLVNIFGVTSKHNGGTYPILPRSSAQWNFEVERPFWGGLYFVSADANYNNDASKALGVKADKNTKISSKKIAVWMAPKPAALIIEIAALVLLVAIVVWVVRSRRHKTHVRTKWTTYHVKEGDTIKSIAEEYDVPWKKLARVNAVKPPYDLKKGQSIKVPPGN